ncbi:hypothetical protein H8959_020054 [Pygathrix nigripes]
MGSRKCGGCLSCLLIPLALWSIIVNILLYFPNGQTSYASSHKLTNYVWYFEGICFSGVMMLIVATVLLVLENNNNYKCCQSENCSKKYVTLLSIIFSSLGIAFSGYCLVISVLGLIQGPYCRTLDGWEYAFEGTAGRQCSQSTQPAKEIEIDADTDAATNRYIDTDRITMNEVNAAIELHVEVVEGVGVRTSFYVPPQPCQGTYVPLQLTRRIKQFQHMDSVPGTCTCCGVEYHFVFHSHNPQWASSDHLPRQSSHAIIQDTVWKLFSDHPVTLLNTASIRGALGLNTSAISPFVSSMDTVNNGLSTPALCQSQGAGWGDTEENIFLLDACCANSPL